MSTPTARRVVRELIREGIDLPDTNPDCWRIKSLRTGTHQRSAGAWSWRLEHILKPTPYPEVQIGGYYSAYDCGRKGAEASREFHDKLAGRKYPISLDPPRAFFEARQIKKAS